MCLPGFDEAKAKEAVEVQMYELQVSSKMSYIMMLNKY